MLQRLLAVGALLASAATISDAVQVHIRVHHKTHDHHTTQGNAHVHARAAAADTVASTDSSATGSAAAAVGDSDVYAFSPVTSIQARVQGTAPTWDEKTSTWVASFGKTYDEKFRSVLDTVNTASVEGALMYVQAEGINVNEQSVPCERKNKMQYVVFYEISVVQPNASLAYYANKATTLEYCPYVAMDGGMCTLAGKDAPDACKQYDGIDGQPKLGHCVGAGEQTTDKRAPYPGNYWFSFPGSCVTKPWAEKTDECRDEFPGGLCESGVKPDGVKCTYTYKILGYLNIDDLVGITDGSYADDGKKFGNYTEFCIAGNVEFAANNTGDGFKVTESIDFWKNPGDEDANTERTEKMIEKYNEMAPEAEVGTMTVLPEITDLAKTNPPCYLNSVECATAANGCRRTLYSQICQVCETVGADCKAAPSGYTYPKLEYPKAEGSSEGSGSGSGKGGADAGDSTPGKSAASGAVASVAAVAVTVVAAALL